MTRRVRMVPLFAILAGCSHGAHTNHDGGGGVSSGTGGFSSGSGGSANGNGGSASNGGSANGNGGGAGSSAAGGNSDPGSGGASAAGSAGRGAGASSAGAGDSTTGGGGHAGSTTTACAPATSADPSGNDAVAGNLVVLNDNGGWNWFSDERSIVDPKARRLFVGSVASGGARDGNIEAVVYDIATCQSSAPASLGNLPADDHSTPAFALRPDGKVAVMWAGHRSECISHHDIWDGASWTAAGAFDWTAQGCPWDGSSTNKVTYQNLWYLSAENRIYSGVRALASDPNLLVSSDDGASYSYFGRLTKTGVYGFGEYYKYWGNGTDRLDFVGTEAHPRDNDNNLWHGYVKSGKAYDSNGSVVDDDTADNITDVATPKLTQFTKLFATGSMVGPVQISHAWVADLVHYDDGVIAVIWTGRANTGADGNDPDLRLLYARYDGSSWKQTYLGKAGPKLYAEEQDYTGLGALDPDDPRTIYISTTFDPRDESKSFEKHEIFQGTTSDAGQTFQWTPITQRSSIDNLRPIVPKWDGQHRALLWMRGTYSSAQKYDTQIVGLVGAR